MGKYKWLTLGTAMILAFAPPLAARAKPVRSIDVYVQPYYQASATQAKRIVRVGRAFDALLTSDRRADVLAARDAVLAKPDLITPMTMMVLAARLYDVGERDESIFWFYVAKDRFITVDDIVDLRGAGSDAGSAIGAFATLIGPHINGYAFCQVARQQALRRRAFDWVKAHPYGAIFIPALRAKPNVKDRKVALAKSLDAIAAGMAKERAFLADPRSIATLKITRAQNEMDQQYCW